VKTVARAEGIAQALGARDFCIQRLKRMPWFMLPLRYFLQSLDTVAVLRRERPQLIITTNPPIVLPLVVYAFARWPKADLVIDSHTGAFTGKWRPFLFLHRFLSRRALATLVTNETLREQVAAWGASALVLEDRVPELPIVRTEPTNPCFTIVVVNSFARDEPVEEVLAAARGLSGFRFFITGGIPKGLTGLLEQAPSNVTFTGFLPRPDYVAMLSRADAIMVLTTRDLTMLCGAYEAVAVGKPLITSDWPVLRNYFSKGAVYIDNSAESIRRAALEVADQNQRLRDEMRELKSELSHHWNRQFEDFCNHINASLKLNDAAPLNTRHP
jgi:glycosyltransferase involved in cell wall biosynthesis